MDAVAIRPALARGLGRASKRGKQRTRALLHDAQVASVDGDLITLTAPSPTLARMISEDSNVEVVRTALRDEVGGDWRITVQALDALPGRSRLQPGRPGHRRPRALAERDPRDDTDFAAPPPTPADPEARCARICSRPGSGRARSIAESAL